MIPIARNVIDTANTGASNQRAWTLFTMVSSCEHMASNEWLAVRFRAAPVVVLCDSKVRLRSYFEKDRSPIEERLRLPEVGWGWREDDAVQRNRTHARSQL
ncbi:hypothetical protein CIT31_15980 [Mesorhizobium wenxiniae]|uniref:Uncharacterized protein n=1 Tax=Mesorhizobium wenxiniae TaxID=2014805 RepID=A0A271KKG2_9HYPH|nr:hypothetical protein CIT31_15980 [Mesorhizobium wenxiniae]